MASYSQYYKLFTLGVAGSAALGLTQVIPISAEQDRKLRHLGLKVLPDVKEEPRSRWGDYWQRCTPEDSKPVTATINLLFVRHGSNVVIPDSDRGELTITGRDQVSHSGQRLLDLAFPYTWVNTCIYNSTKKRSQETANIITSYLPEVRMEHDDLLQGGLPGPEVTPSPMEDFESSARMEAAYRKYVRRARADQIGDSYKVIVCHSDVMRYILGRALEQDPSSSARVQQNKDGLTMLSVLPDGRVKLRVLDDEDHMTSDTTAVNPTGEQSLAPVL